MADMVHDAAARNNRFDGPRSYRHRVSSLRQAFVEVTGIPLGAITSVSINRGILEMNGSISPKMEKRSTLQKRSRGSVKFSVQVPGEATLPSNLSVGLRSESRLVAAFSLCRCQGRSELQQLLRANMKWWCLVAEPYSIATSQPKVPRFQRHTINVVAALFPSVSLTLVAGSVEIKERSCEQGRAGGRDGGPGAKNPEADRDLFRRDQSDLDGTFVRMASFRVPILFWP